MAKLSQFSRDPDAMRDGEWIDAGPEFGGIRLKTRAMTSKYADCRNGKMKLEARRAGGEDRVGQKDRNRIDIEALCETCLLDIDGLTHDDAPDGTLGAAVTLEEFCALLLKEENAELAIMAFKCAGQVGQAKRGQAEDAAGN